VPSVRRTHLARLAALAGCGLLLIGGAAGCSTTQEKAQAQQARAKHILAARAERQKQKRKHGKSNNAHQKGSRKP
jgi:hypothetical protein